VEAKAEQRKLHEKVMKLKDKNEPAHALLKFATFLALFERSNTDLLVYLEN
jgi:hypothetical protein